MEKKLIEFISDLTIIEEAMYTGLQNDSIASASSEIVLKVLSKFQKNIVMFRNAPLLKTPTLNDYNNFITSNSIEKYMSSLLFTLKSSSNSSEKLSVNTMQLFENTAKSIAILRAIIENLLEEYINIHKDDELFKPVNIDKQKIISSLDNALLELEKIINIDQSYKKNILIYINTIRLDINKENPPWASIFGKLRILGEVIGCIAALVTLVPYIEYAYESINGSSFKTPIQTEYIYQVPVPQIENKEIIDTVIA